MNNSEAQQSMYYAGRKIRLLRELNGVTQQELAAELGVSFQQVGKYEKGKDQLSLWRIIQLCKIFRVRPTAFFEGGAV